MTEIPMDYVALDLETTGLHSKYEKIIEIGAARVRNGQVTDTFSAFVNPGRSLPERIVELTGISDTDVINAPYIEEIWEDFLRFTGEDVLLGQNLTFDFAFLKRAAVGQKQTFDRMGIDTLKIARQTLAELESRRLGDLCEYYQIHLDAHRALNDAIATHEVYQRLVKGFSEKMPELFEPKKLVYHVKKNSPITRRQYETLLRLAQQNRFTVCREPDGVGMRLMPIENVTTESFILQRLTKSEASRLIDNILSAFGQLRP